MGKSPLAEFAHSHPFVEMQRPVMPVHVQLHPAGFRTHRTDIRHGAPEKQRPRPDTLKTGQNINFMQVEEPPALPFDRDVAARLPVGRNDKPHVPRPELPAQTLLGVHPLHHVVELPGTQQVTVGCGKRDGGDPPDRRNPLFGDAANGKHRLNGKRPARGRPMSLFLQEIKRT